MPTPFPDFIQFTHPYNFEAEVLGRLDLILENQQAAAIQEKNEMSALDDALAAITTDMTAQTTVIASLKPFIQGLFDQIAAMVPNLTPAQTAALNALKASVDTNNAAIAAAMVANTPPPPPPAA